MLVALLVLCVASLSLPAAHGDQGGGSEPRPGNLLGARIPVSTSSPELKEYTQLAVQTFNTGSNSIYYFRDTKVLKAEKQLVSGIKYFLTMLFGSTQCRKGADTGEGVNLTQCPFSAEQENFQCDFEILQVPWKNQTTVQKFSCLPA
ncbi:cystatin-M [Antechinus flavipes]|uniref:cystatin-M n=1 Tax=Antechinus flavipes TaxID=38775 RepID=UPI002236AED4|nr:cystatin-M [Antechinus flavipes]